MWQSQLIRNAILLCWESMRQPQLIRNVAKYQLGYKGATSTEYISYQISYCETMSRTMRQPQLIKYEANNSMVVHETASSD